LKHANHDFAKVSANDEVMSVNLKAGPSNAALKVFAYRAVVVTTILVFAWPACESATAPTSR
jgi:hypothetical protein